LEVINPVETLGGLTLISLLALSAWVEWKAICWVAGYFTQ
jgi:hypothetical protein